MAHLQLIIYSAVNTSCQLIYISSIADQINSRLNKKRVQDRDAQRALRERTKKHIEGLQKRITELEQQDNFSVKLVQALQRNDELLKELVVLRSIIKNDQGIEALGLYSNGSTTMKKMPVGTTAMRQGLGYIDNSARYTDINAGFTDSSARYTDSSGYTNSTGYIHSTGYTDNSIGYTENSTGYTDIIAGYTDTNTSVDNIYSRKSLISQECVQKERCADIATLQQLNHGRGLSHHLIFRNLSTMCHSLIVKRSTTIQILTYSSLVLSSTSNFKASGTYRSRSRSPWIWSRTR
jgi:hypothetical protein